MHGIVLISGLLAITAQQYEADAREALVKAILTVAVFWLAHVYCGVVAHLGDDVEGAASGRVRVHQALDDAVHHSWGLIAAAAVPLVVLGLGSLGLISNERAIWGTLWLDVAILGLLGYLGVASWSWRTSFRLLGACCTALLGVLLILLKTLIH